MKKTLLILGLVALTSAPAMASGMMFGATAGYDYNEMKGSGGGESLTFSVSSFNVSALADFTYLRFGVGYTKNYSDMKAELSSGGFTGSGDIPGTDYSFLNFSALAKYPFTSNDGLFALWPALGLGYDINLTSTSDGGDIYNSTELDDLYLLVGLGFDYFTSPSVAITVSGVAGINLTPKPSSVSTSGVDFSGYKFDLNVGVLFKL